MPAAPSLRGRAGGEAPTAMPESPSFGRGWGGPRPVKNREAFFDCVEEGLQNYFDLFDEHWGGILHLTVGVKCGQVGGIIKAESMLSYEGFTLERVRNILAYVLPRFVPRTEVPLAVEAVIEELRMGKEEEKASPSPSRGGVTRTPRKTKGKAPRGKND